MTDLGGAVVIPLAADGQPRWPTRAVLEAGGLADMAIVRHDPRDGGPLEVIGLIRDGVLVSGELPGAVSRGGTSHEHQD